ncbi:MAG TPA: sugar transferase [Candidatus Krumholzibacteria bacterium]|nr:sugar transferase [Candidatus Krumholzibacteria bacterium]
MSSVSRLQTLPVESDCPRPSVVQAAPDWQFELSDPVAYRIGKRLFDLVFALCGLVLLLPLLPFVIALIKLDSPGAVLFAQRRVGRKGRLFTCYKFRSMVQDAESMKATLAGLNEASGPAFKIRDDPRITRVGSFLRRSSLDEVPQLLCVLQGTMSVVGPRPQIPAEVELYAPWHRRRLEIKPGITCLWQIAGRSHVGFDEWMRLDLEYLRRRGLMFDLWIVLHTLPAVIARKGAY